MSASSRPGSRPRHQRAADEARAPGLPAREGALALLSAVLDRGRMLEESTLAASLSASERAEAHSLADLTLRRLGQIDALLAGLIERRPKPPILHALRLMAAELAFGARAPHAAVDCAVRIAKARAPRMAGLVNAVGRRLAQEQAPGDFAADETNMPDWLTRPLRWDWGTETATALTVAHLVPPPIDLTLRAPADAEALAAELGAEALPTGSLRLTRGGQISALPGFTAGAWWVQDAAAALPVRLLGALHGKRVLDLCAAPGAKTLQLAAAGAQVTALDISERRLARLEENLARTGLTVEIVAADAFEWQPEAPFEAIVVDAPCSATGTLRRHPDLAWRKPPDLAVLTELQSRLLARAWDWLAPEGRLLYCTCSLLRAEGEDRAAAFLAARPEAALAPLPHDPALAPFLSPTGLRTRPDLWPAQWPGQGGLDGFFAAAFERTRP